MIGMPRGQKITGADGEEIRSGLFKQLDRELANIGIFIEDYNYMIYSFDDNEASDIIDEILKELHYSFDSQQMQRHFEQSEINPEIDKMPEDILKVIKHIQRDRAFDNKDNDTLIHNYGLHLRTINEMKIDSVELDRNDTILFKKD